MAPVMDGALAFPPLILPRFLPLCLVCSRTQQPLAFPCLLVKDSTDVLLAEPRLLGGRSHCFLSLPDISTAPRLKGTQRERKTLPSQAHGIDRACVNASLRAAFAFSLDGH